MSKDLEVGIKNTLETKRLLASLGNTLQKKVSRGALKASAKPIIKKMRQNLKEHRRTGTLRRAIKTDENKRGGRGRSLKNVTLLVGAIKADGVKFLPGGFYARFLEVGTSRQPPNAWARPAFDDTVDEQRKILAKEYQKRGLKEVKKLAAKHLKRV